MRQFRKQQLGGVTILLVTLVGISVMIAVAALAYSINNKKEASVAAHAQTNVQMMAWAGTGAFFEYIKAKGLLGLDQFKALQGTTVTLRSQGAQTVIAKNIVITGACAVDGDLCEISADISADNSASKAANTVNVRYKMRVQNGGVTPAANYKAALTGNLRVLGEIRAETPGADVEINIKQGNLYLEGGMGAEIKDMGNLTFNVDGEVEIRCGLIPNKACDGATKININASKCIKITDLAHLGHFGDLKSKKCIELHGAAANNLSAVEHVTLDTGARVDNIQAGGDVKLYGGVGDLRSSAKNIDSNSDVRIDWSSAENIQAQGSVAVTNGGTTKEIWSNENVTVNIAGTTVNGNIKARGYVNVNTGPNLNVNGDITAGGANTTTDGASVYIFGAGVNVAGHIYSNGYVQALYGSIHGVTTTGDVSLGLSALTLSGVNGGGGNITAGGSVYVGGDTTAVGNVSAVGNVRIGTSALVGSKASVGDIHSGGSVQVYQGSTANNIQARSYVKIGTSGLLGSAASAANIQSGGNVELYEGSSAANITAVGAVQLGTSQLLATQADANNIIAGGGVSLYQGSSAASIVSHGQVILGSSSNIVGDRGYVPGFITAKQNVYVWQGSDTGNINSQATVRVHSGLIGNKSTTGNICAASVDTSTIALLNYYSIGTKKTYSSQCTFTLAAVPTAPATPAAPAAQNVLSYAGVDEQAIIDEIDGKFNFNSNVDVRKYKDEANYIFTKNGKFSRVYLNKLKDPATGDIYSYKEDPVDLVYKQYVNSGGTETVVGDGGGFYLGKYTLGGSQKYVGAICESVDGSKNCNSEIISYLPRVSAEDRPFDDNFESLRYTDNLLQPNSWQIRNFFTYSNIDNATVAPGIFYFEGNLEIHGQPNIQADPTSNAYTNTFLAEGDVTALVASPRIYSPYNILRVKSDASIICNRSLARENGSVYTVAPSTTPASRGYKFLVPTNLCKDNTRFAYSMDKDPSTKQKLMLNIDGNDVPKLDLGYVAIMSNKTVRLGACAQVFGDVLARKRVEVSAACGITSETQLVVGNITSQNYKDGSLEDAFNDNPILSGGKWVLPKQEFSSSNGSGSGSGSGSGASTTINPSSIEMTWAKSL